MINSHLFQSLKLLLEGSLSILQDKPEETPTSCLMALWHKADGRDVSAGSAASVPLKPLGPEAEAILHELIGFRLKGMPLAYLTGRQQFMGIDFIATPQAVIPRKDTEPLANALLEAIKQRQDHSSSPLLVIDMFTGSGNVPLSLARLAPGPRYYGSDISIDAIDLARRNARHHQLESSCVFECGDMFAQFAYSRFFGNVDFVSGAPPFISSGKVPNMPPEIADHEPSLAFDAGPFGVALFLRLIADAPRFLKPGGWLFFETGLGQGSPMLKRLAANPQFDNAKTYCDSRGDIRVVAGRRV
jgi:release factor glutamine methyltransferase